MSKIARALILQVLLFSIPVFAATPPAADPNKDSIANRGAAMFINAPGLNQEEKLKLMDIYVKTYNEAVRIKNEIIQAKTELFRTVATKEYKSAEIEKLKQKIVQLDNQRLEIMFKALADVQKVVGYGKGKEDIYKHLQDYEHPQAKADGPASK